MNLISSDDLAGQHQILQSRSLAMVVQEQILHLIMQGAFEMGEKLPEPSLAARLAVSRGPVREALRALQETGLVTITKNRGAFVTQLDDRDVRELYEVRVGLDEMVGSLLAARISGDQVLELRSMVERMEKSLQVGNLLHFFRQNIAFHDRIVEMTGNAKLLAVYRRVTGEMQLLRQRGIERGGGRLVSNREHADIVDALASGERDLAVRAMGAHGRAGLARLLAASAAVGRG